MSVDAHGRLTSMNRAAKMLGWTEGEVLGTVMSNLILPKGEDGASIGEGNRELLKVRAEGRQVRLEDNEYLCKSGSTPCSSLRLATSHRGFRRGCRRGVSRHHRGEDRAYSCIRRSWQR